MSLNWVMLKQSKLGFVPLPSEEVILQAPNRTSFALKPVAKPPSSSTYPGNTASAATAASSAKYLEFGFSTGQVTLTNQRLVCLPQSNSTSFDSFAVSYKHIHDCHVTQPWFGPNYWSAIIIPVAEGGLPQGVPFELKLTFNDGGAFEFQTAFEHMRQALHNGITHNEDLPTYSPTLGRSVPVPAPQSMPEHMPEPAIVAAGQTDEAPPPYEEL
ncbi:hypothetical protein V1512DRAFT_258292 [Lipomyces arxii]|uniref:uncharacterized protein n=1 Tax=Lipomyces arxii TaxID=56418 RepID=UPI0034CDDA09